MQGGLTVRSRSCEQPVVQSWIADNLSWSGLWSCEGVAGEHTDECQKNVINPLNSMVIMLKT